MISRRNHASLQPRREVNVAIATIALPVARFLCGLAIYNLMGLAAQLGYFRLAHGKALFTNYFGGSEVIGRTV